jgi:hypothetical protein
MEVNAGLRAAARGLVGIISFVIVIFFAEVTT